ncbi:MAG: indole-3-glycerol phosphate synthase TrpC [Polyangiaceae bacterium]
MGVLAEILEEKRREIQALRSRPLPRGFEPRPVDLARTSGAPLRLIAEIKRRSPSAGELSTRLGADERAAAYAEAGASMVSVLTDARFFGGSFDDLRACRERVSVPLLCKEFVLDELQLDWARASGADAVLLIVRCLEPSLLERLVRAARDRGLSPLVEVVSEAEARTAISAGADWIGVNARDLDTLTLDPSRATRVLECVPSEMCRVHLSGLATEADVAAVRDRAVDAALIGQALMERDDPGPFLRALVRAAAGG